MVSDATNNYTTNRPEHLQHLSRRGSQLYRYDLAAICRRVGNENAPGQALEKLSHEYNWKRSCEVKYKDEDVQEHEAGQGRVTVSDAAGQGASEKDADERTELPRHLKRRLPLGHDDIRVGSGIVYTIFVLERR